MHHELDDNGVVGAANIRACVSGITTLNGARGTIPDSDRQSVYNHLAAHIRDSGSEPPEMKGSMRDNTERKNFGIDLKTLTDEGTFEGSLSVYDFIDAGGDIVEPGAFAKSINENGGKIPLLWQHELKSPVGVGYLTDSGDALECKGVLNLEMPQAREAHSMMKFLQRHGLHIGMSIGYVTIKDTVEKGIRRLKELKLLEGSLVTLPMNRLCMVHDVKSAADAQVHKDFQGNLETLQVSAMKYQLMAAFARTIDEVLYDYDERRSREQKEAALTQAFRDFENAFRSFIPRWMDYAGEKHIEPVELKTLVSERDRETLQKLFKALLGPPASTASPAAAAVETGAAARSDEPGSPLALLRGFSIFGES
jgi:hypothetical protein